MRTRETGLPAWRWCLLIAIAVATTHGFGTASATCPSSDRAIRTIVGQSNESGTSAMRFDGVLPQEACMSMGSLSGFGGIAVAPSGEVYVVARRALWKLGLDGRMHVVTGAYSPIDVRVATDGTIYFI